MSSLEEAAFGGAERLLGSRFLIVALLPVLLVAGTSGLVALAATGQTPDDALRSWQRYGGAAQIVTSLLVVLGLVALAYVLTLFHPPLLRLLEGYWPHWPVLRALHRWCTKRQRARADEGWELVHTMHDASKQATAAALAARLRSAYPPPRHIEVGLSAHRARQPPAGCGVLPARPVRTRVHRDLAAAAAPAPGRGHRADRRRPHDAGGHGPACSASPSSSPSRDRSCLSARGPSALSYSCVSSRGRWPGSPTGPRCGPVPPTARRCA